ncbi:MAG: Hsp70 family protein [Candidatus Hydrogenedens sp.]|jgi:hypothetical chaperone protein|nr:Hsp70 family protein [Candidatus Hydrogenedens sp.]
MTRLFCGIDFGTTNSSAAVATDKAVHLLPLDAVNDSPTSLPSLLYLSQNGEVIVGREAANTFVARNVDREIKTEQVQLESLIPAFVRAEPDKTEAYNPLFEDPNIVEAVDAKITVEVNSPGRLFQSLKSLLSQSSFSFTEVYGIKYQMEELISYILKKMKDAVDDYAGYSVESAVFGRPVRFSENDADNELAERRLRVAASLAGFKEVVFFYEPVGACVEYAAGTQANQRVMVVDIGGGTCDVSIMEFLDKPEIADRLASSRVLSVAGTPVAGDALDKAIIRSRFFPLLGSHARYGPSRLPMPQHIYHQVLDWQNLYKFNTESMINWLLAAEVSSTHPEGLKALRMLIQNNYGYLLSKEAEAAKKRLSTDTSTAITVDASHIHLRDELKRDDFAEIIETMLGKMYGCILEAEKAAGLGPDDLDFVLTTGGTCLVPAVRSLLEKRYGTDKLRKRDSFTSVATGLATVARYAFG